MKDDASERERDPLIGSVIDDKYRVDRRVGEGGFGIVYEARHLSLDVPVALKLEKVPADLDDTGRAGVAARFRESARLLMRLKHPNVAGAIDLGEIAGPRGTVPYLVMEWCEGRSLKAVLAEGHRLALDDVVAIVEGVADALAHAHALGIVHRDVKPSNVMWVEGPHGFSARLIDFGIAKVVDTEPSSATVTSSKLRVFTREYAAPEQIAGEPTGPWTDVHALGLLLIALLTGKPPYGDGAGIDAGLAAVDPLRPTTAKLGVEIPALAPVIARAVASRPEDRYADARAFRDAFSEAMKNARSQGEVTITEHVPFETQANEGRATSDSPRGAVARARHDSSPRTGAARSLAPRLVWASAAVAVAVLLAFGAFRWWSRPRVVASSPLLRSSSSSGGVQGADDSSLPPPAPSGSVGGGDSSASRVGPKPGTFCALPPAELRERLKRIPLPKYGFQPNPNANHVTSILDKNGAWSTVRAAVLDSDEPSERLRLAKEILASEYDGLDVLDHWGIAYAMSGNCLTLVRGPAASSRGFVDALLGEDAVDQKGDTFGGPAPIPFVAIPAPSWSGTGAARLADLSEGEFVERVRKLGLRDARRIGVALELEVGVGGKNVSIVYASGPDIAKHREKITTAASVDDPAYWAIDGPVLVAAFGPRQALDAPFVSNLLRGLQAKIEREPPLSVTSP